MVTKEDIKEKLDFIGLDLDNLPDFLFDRKSIRFNPSRLNNDKELKVYKYIPIKDIEIYCTSAYRDDPIREKYSKSSPLIEYLNPTKDEDSDKYAAMLKMLDNFSVEEFYEINNIQNEMNVEEPFKVFYNRSQLWQIYYSEDTNKYFMLVSTKEDTYSELFYLLKKQIEIYNGDRNEDEKIFVPISFVNYSETILKDKEIGDMVNYLWVFTKNWPLVYEVYDKNDNLSLQIIGETNVYDEVKSIYKVVLNDKNEANDFYKLIKALFILQTELSNKYVFKTQIDNNSSLEFTYNDKKIFYDDLVDFIKDRYNETEMEIKKLNHETNDLETRLKSLKLEVKHKESEYFMKQKEISTFLECKKSFFGKVKYFFKGKKKNVKREKEKGTIEEELEEQKNSVSKPMQVYVDDKKYRTIEDLVTINSLYEKAERYVNDLKQDISALEIKSLNISKKIENAMLYINEIDKHKKSIFNFWKFTNKDELVQLEVGNEYTRPASKLKRKFDFESDFEDLGISVDKIQRTKLSKIEQDNIFIANSKVLPIINMLKDSNMDKDQIEILLNNLKEDYSNSDNNTADSFDIFGSVKDDHTQLKYIGNKSHRENEKNLYQILNINKQVDVFDFTERLQLIVNSLNESLSKIKSLYDMSIYKIIPINDKLHQDTYEIYNMNIEKELDNYEHKEESAIKIIKINIKEDMPILYLSNIMFFDNQNETLPLGMNISTKVLIDSSKYNFDLKEKVKFKTNEYFNDDKSIEKPKIIYVYLEEYDVSLKDNK